MKKVFYNKLIRDKIPEKIEKAGEAYEIKKLRRKEFEIELLKKVEEEASALPKCRTKKEIIAELADIMDVIDETKKLKNISDNDIKKAQTENAKNKGGFNKKIFLFWSEDKGYKTNEKRRV